MTKKTYKAVFAVTTDGEDTTATFEGADKTLSDSELHWGLSQIVMVAKDASRKAVTRMLAKAREDSMREFVDAQLEERGIGENVGENERSLIAQLLAAHEVEKEQARNVGGPDRKSTAWDPLQAIGRMRDESIVADPPAPGERREVRFVESSPHSSKPFSEMTLEELREEETHWQSIIDGSTAWGAGVGAANGFLKECQSWITRRQFEAERAERDTKADEAGSTMRKAFMDAVGSVEDAVELTREQVVKLTGLGMTAISNHIHRNGFPRPNADGKFMKDKVIDWMQKYTKEATHVLAQPTVAKLTKRLEDLFDSAISGMTEEEPAEEPVEKPENFRVYSADVPDFVGIPDPTAIYNYQNRFGFPQKAGRDGRKVYWNSSDLITWMETFLDTGRPAYFPKDRMEAIAKALAKAKGTKGEDHTPRRSPKEVMDDLSWSAKAFVLFVGEEDEVDITDIREKIRDELIRAGLIELVKDKVILTDAGLAVYELVNDTEEV